LRAPIYEEKVVNHILGLARVEDRKVTRDELLKPIDDELPDHPTIEIQPPVA
jgi:trigger factor